MNTNNVIARTRLPTAKNAFPDRTYTNGSVTGMNVFRREEKNRPENEAYLRGYATYILSEARDRHKKTGIEIPDEMIIRAMKRNNIQGAYLL